METIEEGMCELQLSAAASPPNSPTYEVVVLVGGGGRLSVPEATQSYLRFTPSTPLIRFRVPLPTASCYFLIPCESPSFGNRTQKMAFKFASQ